MDENWDDLLHRVAPRVVSRDQARFYSRLPTNPSKSATIAPRSMRRCTVSVGGRDQGIQDSDLLDYTELENAPASSARGSKDIQHARIKRAQTQPAWFEAGRTAQEAADVEEILDGEEPVIVENPMSCSAFVEKSWFQVFSAMVIISNVITTIIQLDKPETKNMFFVADQVVLGFYVVELCVRGHYFRTLFFLGPCKLACWNILDIIVVVAGVLDQWLMPVLAIGDNRSIDQVLRLMKLLRILRVFKIVRVFLETDLSWIEDPLFQSFIGIVIVINSLLMGMEIDVPWSGWFWIEQVLLCIYVFELGVRLKNFGADFFSCDNADLAWNVLDFVIVSSSVLDSWIVPLCGLIVKSVSGTELGTSQKQQEGLSLGKFMMLMRMLRLMRILRLAKLVKAVRPLYILVTGVMAALQGVAWVLVLTVVTLYAAGILATSLIGRKMLFDPSADIPEDVLKPFHSVPDSMFTLFRIMSGASSDKDFVAIDKLMVSVPSIKLGFVFFMVTSSWTLLSILTAVVSENMISTTSQQEEEHKFANAEEVHIEHMNQLRELFHHLDVTQNGFVDHKEIEAFLSDKNNALLTARLCRVPVRDVKEVLQFVVDPAEGGRVDWEKFVGYLADLSSVVTEKSVLQIISRLTNLSRHQSEQFARLQEQVTSWLDLESSKSNAMSSPDCIAEAISKEVHKKVEAVCKGQLQEVESFMRGFAERTEACLAEVQTKNQGVLEGMTKALEQALPNSGLDKFSDTLELQFHRMQYNLLRDLKGLEAGDGSGARAPGVQMQFSAAQVEAMLVATEDSIQALQQTAESMFGRGEGSQKQMSEAVNQGLAVDKSSETLEFELRAIRQELLFCLGRQSLESSSVSVHRAPGDQMAMLAAQVGPRLLASKESPRALRQKTEAMLRQLEGLLEKAVINRRSALAVDKFSETLESELRTMLQQTFPSLTGQDTEVLKVKDEHQQETALTDVVAHPLRQTHQ